MAEALTIAGLDCFYGQVQVLHGLDLLLPGRLQLVRLHGAREAGDVAGAVQQRLDAVAAARFADRHVDALVACHVVLGEGLGDGADGG